MKLVAALLYSLLLLPATLAFGPSTHPNEASVAVTNAVNSLPKSKDNGKVKKSGDDVVVTQSMTTHRKKKWGVDNEHPNEYWFDERIHTLGNNGFWGGVHAAVVPISTKIIDVAAYQGVDVRKKIAEELSKTVRKQKARVVDLCCGVGFSTRALQHAFPDAETVLGIDTSPEMVAMAQFITDHISSIKPYFRLAANRVSDGYKSIKLRGYAMKQNAFFKATKFVLRNAEDTKLPDRSFDLVTIMYAFHEAPMKGRAKILKEARRLLSPGGTLAVIDISTDYVPSENMLKGEPYVQEYQKNIHKQLQVSKGFERLRYKDIIPHHLGMWTLKRSATAY